MKFQAATLLEMAIVTMLEAAMDSEHQTQSHTTMVHHQATMEMDKVLVDSVDKVLVDLVDKTLDKAPVDKHHSEIEELSLISIQIHFHQDHQAHHQEARHSEAHHQEAQVLEALHREALEAHHREASEAQHLETQTSFKDNHKQLI